MAYFLQIAELVRYRTVLLHQLDEVVRGQVLLLRAYPACLAFEPLQQLGAFVLGTALCLLTALVIGVASEQLIRNHLGLVDRVISVDLFEQVFGVDRRLLKVVLQISFIMQKRRFLRSRDQYFTLGYLHRFMATVQILVPLQTNRWNQQVFGRAGLAHRPCQ